jgi:hypothetical protein
MDSGMEVDYWKNRSMFLELAWKKKWRLWGSFEYPKRTSFGNTVTTDVCHYPTPRRRSGEKKKILVIISGTGGLEGATGSIAQHCLINSDIPSRYAREGIDLLFIHALNPWGYAEGRRVDHLNVEVDLGCGETFPDSPDYVKIRELVEPQERDLLAVAKLTEWLEDEANFQQLRDIARRGQYRSPRGPFYGGRMLCWSGQQLRTICESLLRNYAHVGVIDIRTGSGGYGRSIVLSPLTSTESDDAVRTKAWFGDKVLFPNAEASVVSPIHGDVLSAMIRWLPDAQVTGIAIKSGTGILQKDSFIYLVEENWVYHHRGRLPGFEEVGIEESFIEVFDRGDPEWQSAVVDNIKITTTNMFVGLA